MLSVVIPALNEERALPATLRSVFAQSGDFEVILVDGGSRDATLAVADHWAEPRLQVIAARAGRASQMNAGAAIARGEMLLFLHADTLLPPGAIQYLNVLESDPAVQWGGFHQHFSSQRADLRVVSAIHNLRCRVTDVFYGDQCQFVRRGLFESVGGFPDEPRLEDIMLSDILKKHTAPVFLDAAVVTDSRKFEQMGVIRSLFRCLLILASYELRLPILGRRFFAEIR